MPNKDKPSFPLKETIHNTQKSDQFKLTPCPFARP